MFGSKSCNKEKKLKSQFSCQSKGQIGVLLKKLNSQFSCQSGVLITNCFASVKMEENYLVFGFCENGGKD